MEMYFLNIIPEGAIINKKPLEKVLFAKSGVSLEENKWIERERKQEEDLRRQEELLERLEKIVQKNQDLSNA